MAVWQSLIPGRQSSPFAPRPAALGIGPAAPVGTGFLDDWAGFGTTTVSTPNAATFGATTPQTRVLPETAASFTDLGAPNDGMTSWGSRYGDVSGGDPYSSWADVRSSRFKDYGFGQQTSSPPGGSFGNVATVGGQWSALDAHNAEIAAAAAQYGVPGNLIKSMINRESSGNWDANNYTYGGLRGQRMLPFVGIFESTAQSWGLDFNAMQGNKAAQIAGMAKILRGLADQYGGFENAAYVYFGGESALPGRGGFTDEYGMDSSTYGQKAIDGWKQLDQLSGYTGGYGGGTTGGNIESLLQGGKLYDWGAFGADSDNGYYGYGTNYGLNGRQHTGADIAAPRGANYFAPMGGTVMCAGTGVGTAADGSSCSAFGDTGGGAGRIEVLLDNGAVLIYGHSSAAALAPGARFNAGDVLGKVGTMNSDHIHLEARVRDASTPSGWRIVDPATVTGGGSFGGGGGSGYAGPQQQSFSDLMAQYLFRR